MSDAARDIEGLDENSIVLRLGTAEDIPAAVELGRRMVDEFERFKGMPYNAEKMTANALAFMSKSHHLFIVAQAQTGELVGFLTGLLDDYGWADDHYAQEHLWYLIPELRGGQVHAALFQAFEHWATINRSREIFNTMYVDPERAAAMEQMMRRMGYKKMGITCWKPLRHG